MFNYEIDDNNAVHVYADGNDQAVLVQDLAPTGKPWKDKAEAKKWADAYLDGIDQRIAEAVAALEAAQVEPEPVPAEPEPEPEA
jgi:hypothetical protein